MTFEKPWQTRATRNKVGITQISRWLVHANMLITEGHTSCYHPDNVAKQATFQPNVTKFPRTIVSI